jgi:hypothetical protein
MSDKPKRTGLSHMEQILEFPVGTLVGHTSFRDHDIFKVIGWFANALEVVRLRADMSTQDPGFFTQIDCVTIIGEATHEF